MNASSTKRLNADRALRVLNLTAHAALLVAASPFSILGGMVGGAFGGAVGGTVKGYRNAKKRIAKAKHNLNTI